MNRRTIAMMAAAAVFALPTYGQQRQSSDQTKIFIAYDGAFQFSYPGDFQVCTEGKIEPCNQSFIPVCEQDALVCVVSLQNYLKEQISARPRFS